MCVNGIVNMNRIAGNMTSQKYRRVLSHSLIPEALKKVGRGFILIQDNASTHRSKMLMAYLKRKEKAGVLRVVKIPPRSPDVNIDENLFAELQRRTEDRVCETEDELWELISRTAEEIPQSFFESLVKSMPSRCEAIFECEGHFSRY